MASRVIVNAKDVRSDISVTDLKSVIASTLVAAEIILDPDTLHQFLNHQFFLADSPSFGLGKGFSETLTIGEAISSIGVGKGFSDSASITESINITLEILRAFSDLISFVDAPAIETSRGFSDQQQMSESDTKSFSAVKADSLSFSDSEVLNFGKAPSDQVVLSESLAFSGNSNRFFTDAFSLDDAATVDAIRKDTANAKTNVFSFADAQAFGFGKAASDSFSLSESIDTFVFGKGVTDAVSVTENINVLLFSNAAMNAATLNSAPFNE